MKPIEIFVLVSSVEHWEDKWMNNEAMMKEIGKLIVYEIMRRVEDYEV